MRVDAHRHHLCGTPTQPACRLWLRASAPCAPRPFRRLFACPSLPPAEQPSVDRASDTGATPEHVQARFPPALRFAASAPAIHTKRMFADAAGAKRECAADSPDGQVEAGGKWRARRDSNPRPMASEATTLS